jgi:hypothetical protein
MLESCCVKAVKNIICSDEGIIVLFFFNDYTSFNYYSIHYSFKNDGNLSEDLH